MELGTAATILGGISTGVQAINTIAAGKAQQQQYDYQAAQAEANAKAARASASVEASNQAREGEYTLSRGLAVAAASGADPNSPSIENVEQQVAGNSEFNVLTSVFNGEERARGYEQQALSDRYMGKSARKASVINAVSGIAKSGAGMLQNYGSPFQSQIPSDVPSFDSNQYGPYQPMPWQT